MSTTTPTPTPAPTVLPVQHQQVITDTNKSPLIEIMAYLMMSISVLSLIARLGTKLIQTGKLKLDDHLASASTAAAVAQSIAVLVQVSNGWGQHFDTISDSHASHLFQAGYAADVLFIVSLGLAKISFAMTVSTLTIRSHKYMVWILISFISLWAVSGLLVVLFQCNLPSPWVYINSKCVDRAVFWTYFSVLNIVTDVAVIGITVEAIRRIQTTWSKKVVVMGVFGSRVFILPAIVAQIYYSYDSLASQDPTFDMWLPSIIIQVVQFLSIFTACVPILKPFLDSLETGQMRADYLRRKGRSGYGYNSDRSKSKSYMNSAGKSIQKVIGSANGNGSVMQSQTSNVHELTDLPKQRRNEAFAVATHEHGGSWDGQSRISQRGLIQQTKTWEVEIESRSATGISDDQTTP